jgi:hypothetical protein
LSTRPAEEHYVSAPGREGSPIVNVFQSSADTGKKVLWTVLVIILPVLGFILWYFLGPKTAGKG